MTNHDSKKIALNWRWLKILLPLWVIFGGTPLIFMGRTNGTTIMAVLAAAFIVALAATAVCIKCFLFYLDENERQKQEPDRLQGEALQHEAGNGE